MLSLNPFQSPWALCAALPAAWMLWRWYRRLRGGPGAQHLVLRASLRALALSMLILAWSGLRWPVPSRPLQIVAAVDLSESIYDRKAQEEAFRELTMQLKDSGAELGVVVFGRTAGLERPLAALPRAWFRPSVGKRGVAEPPPGRGGGPSAWPRFANPRMAIETDATDLGRALAFARGQFPPEDPAARAIVLLSDGLDTQGQAALAASALHGGGFDLLAWPAGMEATADVHLASIRLPPLGHVGRGLPVEVTVAGGQAVQVNVRVARRMGDKRVPVKSGIVTLRGGSGGPRAREYRATLTVVDQPERTGVVEYSAELSGPRGEPLPGDYLANNALRAAVRVAGPSRWAVLARPESTLARWARSSRNVLGVKLKLFEPGRFPGEAGQYAGFSGVLVDGLPLRDLPPEAPALKALAGALRAGLGLVAVGGEEAFGAGGHRAGPWEALLPVTFRPEDDRTRTVLFLVDVSGSMKQSIPEKGVKLDFARAQLGKAVQALRPSDRVGLIAFSGRARRACSITPDRAAFLDALRELKIENKTNFLAAFRLARETLRKDPAEEQLVVLLSDGIPTPRMPDEALLEALRELCPPPRKSGLPRRTRLLAFGIGTGPQDANRDGEQRMRRFAQAGGGAFYPNFLKLAERLEKVFQERRKDLYTRHEAFGARPVYPHPVITAAGTPWPELPFRNRVKAKPEAEVLLKSVPLRGRGESGSRKPDPLLVLGRHEWARSAVLALALEGEAGRAFLAPKGTFQGGQALLAKLLAWAEGREERARRGWRLETAWRGGMLRVRLRAEDPQSHAPVNGLRVAARLRPALSAQRAAPFPEPRPPRPLWPVAPGRYEALFPAPPPGAYRLDVLEGRAPLMERFVSAPYPPELRRFGADRTALDDLVRLAGNRSRLINLPRRDIRQWMADVEQRRRYTPARPLLLILALLFFLCEIAARGLRGRRGRRGGAREAREARKTITSFRN